MSIIPSLTSPNSHKGPIKSLLFHSSGCVLIIHKVHSSFGQPTSGKYIYIYIYIYILLDILVCSITEYFYKLSYFHEPIGWVEMQTTSENAQQYQTPKYPKSYLLATTLWISYKAGKVIHMLFVFFLVQLDNKSFSHWTIIMLIKFYMWYLSIKYRVFLEVFYHFAHQVTVSDKRDPFFSRPMRF